MNVHSTVILFIITYMLAYIHKINKFYLIRSYLVVI
jgi:hypothetical protein